MMPSTTNNQKQRHVLISMLHVAQGFRAHLKELHGLGIGVIVTSRCSLGCGLGGAEQLNLSSLAPGHAADLLQHEATAKRITPEQAKKLARICGHNALALMIIGGFIASETVTAEVRHHAAAVSTLSLGCVKHTRNGAVKSSMSR